MIPVQSWRGRVALQRHDIEAAGRRWQIYAVKDQDALLAAADAFEVFPYGLLLWDSAVVLADALAGQGDLTGKRVLELGAGVGLAGQAARHRGAEVLQTDHSAEALQVARDNAALNGLDGVEQIVADWETWKPPHRFDVILGADILYDQAAHAAIARVIETSLEADGIVLLTDPGRTATPDFVRMMQDIGWRIATETRQNPGLHPSPAGKMATVTLLRLAR